MDFVLLVLVCTGLKTLAAGMMHRKMLNIEDAIFEAALKGSIVQAPLDSEVKHFYQELFPRSFFILSKERKPRCLSAHCFDDNEFCNVVLVPCPNSQSLGSPKVLLMASSLVWRVDPYTGRLELGTEDALCLFGEPFAEDVLLLKATKCSSLEHTERKGLEANLMWQLDAASHLRVDLFNTNRFLCLGIVDEGRCKETSSSVDISCGASLSMRNCLAENQDAPMTIVEFEPITLDVLVLDKRT